MDHAVIRGVSVLLRFMPLQPLITPVDGLNRKVRQNRVWTLYSEELFKRAYLRAHPNFSENEAANVYHYLKEIVAQSHGRQYGLFSLILHITNEVLTQNNETILCKHDEFINWRAIVHGIGQPIFICAHLAWQDLLSNRRRNRFEFSPYAKTDNIWLRNMLSQGMAENHFHLKGSSPVFMLSWICLMNHVANRKQAFRSGAMKRDFFNKESEDHKLSLHEMVVKAAAIRLFLSEIAIWGDNIEPESDEFLLDIIHNDSKMVLGGIRKLQMRINQRRRVHLHSLDYVIDTEALSDAYAPVAGENVFMYHAFRAVFEGNPKMMQHVDLFYAYILIFTRVRSELIQCNDAVGFHNFKLYEQRKEVFVEGYVNYEEALVSMAHCSVLDNSAVKMLEARVTPKKSSYEIEKSMNKTCKLANYRKSSRCKACMHYHAALGKCLTGDGYCHENLERMSYVMHLVKQPDQLYSDDMIGGRRYRHFKYIRDTVEPTVRAISEWRKNGSKAASLVYGIDACNSEIGCRPEVFAPSFRKLRQAEMTRSTPWYRENTLPLMKITFHVGEDFLDIADGLRAIDETICFLKCGHGDRLGHAIALGINVQDWYRFKERNITLPRQDLMDNVVWLYMSLHQWGLCDHQLAFELKELFRLQFDYIYRDAIHQAEHAPEITIELYYDSWLLRGDHPKYYASTHFLTNGFDSPADKNEFLNGEVYEQVRRNNKWARFLMHAYHYNSAAKKLGAEITVHLVTEHYVQGVERIQKKMQQKVATMGIAIETNPSSNYLISTFKRYEQHPILSFNDQGLCMPEKQPQLIVSINTDDQGVFDTDLENEYALMASALDNQTDTDGNRIFKPADVYRWLDNVRKMGLEQSFRRPSV